MLLGMATENKDENMYIIDHRKIRLINVVKQKCAQPTLFSSQS